MLEYGLEWHSLNSYFDFKELSVAPSVVEDDHIRVYAKDKSGTSALYATDDAGTEHELTNAIGGSGSGGADRIAVWASATALTSNASAKIEALTGETHLTLKGTPQGYLQVDGDATGEPYIVWAQNGSSKATIKYIDSGDHLRIQNAGGGGIILSQGNQDYLFTRRAGDTRLLAIQSRDAGEPCVVELYSADGDGTDGMSINLFAKGTPADITNRELYQWGYDESGPHFYIQSGANGSGSVRAIKMSTGANSNQLVLNTDGTVSMLSVLDVGTGYRIAGGATSGNVLRGNGTNFVSTQLAHSDLSGLTTGDPHTQYALLAGRSGGQTLIGGTASGDNLVLSCTSNNTKGAIKFTGGFGGTGTTHVYFGEAVANDWQFRSNSNFTPTADDTSKPAWAFRFGASSDDFAIFRAAAPGGGSLSFLRRFYVNSSGVTVCGDATATNAVRFEVGDTITNDSTTHAMAAIAGQLEGSAGGGEVYGLLAATVHAPDTNIGIINQVRVNCNFAPTANTITNAAGIRVVANTGSGGGAISALIGQEIVPVFGTIKPTNTVGLQIQDMGSASVGTAMGISIAKPTNATTNVYLSFDTADGTAEGSYAGRLPILVAGNVRYISYHNA